MKNPSDKQQPETFNGVVVGAGLVLVALVWFTIPLLINGRVMIYPWILFGLGVLTIVRHAIAQRK